VAKSFWRCRSRRTVRAPMHPFAANRGLSAGAFTLDKNTIYIEHIIHTPSERVPSLVKRRDRDVVIWISSNASPVASLRSCLPLPLFPSTPSSSFPLFSLAAFPPHSFDHPSLFLPLSPLLLLYSLSFAKTLWTCERECVVYWYSIARFSNLYTVLREIL
jgi:hypothetical protein